MMKVSRDEMIIRYDVGCSICGSELEFEKDLVYCGECGEEIEIGEK